MEWIGVVMGHLVEVVFAKDVTNVREMEIWQYMGRMEGVNER